MDTGSIRVTLAAHNIPLNHLEVTPDAVLAFVDRGDGVADTDATEKLFAAVRVAFPTSTSRQNGDGSWVVSDLAFPGEDVNNLAHPTHY